MPKMKTKLIEQPPPELFDFLDKYRLVTAARADGSEMCILVLHIDETRRDRALAAIFAMMLGTTNPQLAEQIQAKITQHIDGDDERGALAAMWLAYIAGLMTAPTQGHVH